MCRAEGDTVVFLRRLNYHSGNPPQTLSREKILAGSDVRPKVFPKVCSARQ